MFEHKGSLLNFSPEHYINGKGEKFKLVICQRGKFSEVEQSCDAVVFIHFCEGSRVAVSHQAPADFGFSAFPWSGTSIGGSHGPQITRI